MSLKSQDRVGIQKLVVGFFDAATGTEFLHGLKDVFESRGDSYSALAQYLEGTEQFQSRYGAGQTDQQFADTVLGGLGLTTNQDANDFVLARLGYGQDKAQLILEGLVLLEGFREGALSQGAQVLANKTSVADYYSQIKAGHSVDVQELQAAIRGVNDSPASATAARAALDVQFPTPGNDQSSTLVAHAEVQPVGVQTVQDSSLTF